MPKQYLKLLLSILGVISFFVAWQIISDSFLGPNSLLPSPIQILKAIANMIANDALVTDVTKSLQRIFWGFLIAFLAAIFLAVLSYRLTNFFAFIKQIIGLLSSIPPIAWTPIAILWFGIGDAPAIFIVFLGAFFPMLSTFYSALNSVDKNLVNAAKTLGATNRFISYNVLFPAALPGLLQGIKIGLNIAWFNVIAAELIGVNSGLGYKIQLNRELLASENVIGLMLVIGLIGIVMNQLVTVFGYLAAPWAYQDSISKKWKHMHHFFRNRFEHSKRPEPDESKIRREYLKINRPLLQIENVDKSYNGDGDSKHFKVLQNITLKIERGQIVSILGPNGSGKTTLINLIAGLISPDYGTILFENEQVAGPSSERSVVFQDLALFPWQTCREHILFSLNLNFYQNIQRSADAYLKMAGLSEYAEKYPFELSGGLKQRLAIMRAIAANPKIILMDEPFASFDPQVRHSSQESILDLLKSQDHITALIVTHDIEEAIFMSDQIIVLTDRPGEVKEIVKVDFKRPRLASLRNAPDFESIKRKLWKMLNKNA